MDAGHVSEKRQRNIMTKYNMVYFVQITVQNSTDLILFYIFPFSDFPFSGNPWIRLFLFCRKVGQFRCTVIQITIHQVA